MTLQDLFLSARDEHFYSCPHPHSKEDFRMQTAGPLGLSSTYILYIVGIKDEIRTQESLNFLYENLGTGGPVIDLICLAFERIDKVLFPSLLMKILEQEIP